MGGAEVPSAGEANEVISTAADGVEPERAAVALDADVGVAAVPGLGVAPWVGVALGVGAGVGVEVGMGVEGTFM